jgi:hypothetical protein
MMILRTLATNYLLPNLPSSLRTHGVLTGRAGTGAGKLVRPEFPYRFDPLKTSIPINIYRLLWSGAFTEGDWNWPTFVRDHTNSVSSVSSLFQVLELSLTMACVSIFRGNFRRRVLRVSFMSVGCISCIFVELVIVFLLQCHTQSRSQHRRRRLVGGSRESLYVATGGYLMGFTSFVHTFHDGW